MQEGKADEQKLVVVSICPQSRASLAAEYKLSIQDVAHKLTQFFKNLGEWVGNNKSTYVHIHKIVKINS